MFQRKPSKRESHSKNPYILHECHSIERTDKTWDQDHYQVVSIDPGIANYAIRVEHRIKNGKIRGLLYDKVKFNPPEDNINQVYSDVTNYLDQYRELFFNSHMIIVEQQLPFNYKSTRIMQHTISYFLIMLKDSPLLPAIFELDPDLKYRLLGAPKIMNHNYLKTTWGPNKTEEILKWRGDTDSIKILRKGKKQDDYADVVLQIEALFLFFNYPVTVEPTKIKLKIRGK